LLKCKRYKAAIYVSLLLFLHQQPLPTQQHPKPPQKHSKTFPYQKTPKKGYQKSVNTCRFCPLYAYIADENVVRFKDDFFSNPAV
jgi:hypothetical protein